MKKRELVFRFFTDVPAEESFARYAVEEQLTEGQVKAIRLAYYASFAKQLCLDGRFAEADQTHLKSRDPVTALYRTAIKAVLGFDADPNWVRAKLLEAEELLAAGKEITDPEVQTLITSLEEKAMSNNENQKAAAEAANETAQAAESVKDAAQAAASEATKEIKKEAAEQGFFARNKTVIIAVGVAAVAAIAGFGGVKYYNKRKAAAGSAEPTQMAIE